MPPLTLMQEPDQLTWNHIARFMRRFWPIIAITCATVVVGAYLTLMCMTDQYESKASLLVRLGRENIELPTTVQNTGIVTTGMRPEELNSEIQIIKSRPLLDEVVDRIGVQAFAFAPPPPKTLFQAIRFYVKRAVRWTKARYNDTLILLNLKKRTTDRENVILLLESAIEATPEKTSDVLSVTVRLPSAPLAVEVERTLLSVYLARRTDLRRNPDEREFFRTELTRRSEQLQQLTAERDAIRARYGVSSIPEQRDMLLKQIADMQTQLSTDKGTDATLKSQQSLMRQRLPQLDGTVRATEIQTLNPAVQSFKERLSELQLERAKAASRYLETAEPVVKIDEEIAALQAQLQKEPRSLTGSTTSEANPVRSAFLQNTEQNDIVLAGLQAHINELSEPLRQMTNRLRSLDIGEEKLESVQRELKLTQDSYLDLSRRTQEAEFDDQLEHSHIANVSLLGAPDEPIEPVYPRKLLIMAISFPVGLTLGCVLALLLFAIDDTIYTEADLLLSPGVTYLGSYTTHSLEAGA